jgi:hypothetical protein
MRSYYLNEGEWQPISSLYFGIDLLRAFSYFPHSQNPYLKLNNDKIPHHCVWGEVWIDRIPAYNIHDNMNIDFLNQIGEIKIE